MMLVLNISRSNLFNMSKASTRKVAREMFGGDERMAKSDPRLLRHYQDVLEFEFRDVDPIKILSSSIRKLLWSVFYECPKILIYDLPKVAISWSRERINECLKTFPCNDN